MTTSAYNDNSRGIYNEIYTTKFLVVIRVNAFAIYLSVV